MWWQASNYVFSQAGWQSIQLMTGPETPNWWIKILCILGKPGSGCTGRIIITSREAASLRKASMFVYGHPTNCVLWLALVEKDPPASAGDVRTQVQTLGPKDSPGRRHGSLLQYSCLKNPIDLGAWQAIVHGVAKSRTRLKLFTRFPPFIYLFWG